MLRILILLALCAAATSTANTQTCTENVLDGFSHTLLGNSNLAIGQSFLACGSGAVTSLTVHEGFADPGGYELWLAPEVGGGNLNYIGGAPYETFADPGGAAPRLITFALSTPYPVSAGVQYRFVLRRADAGDVSIFRISFNDPGGDYAGGVATDTFQTHPNHDLDFELDIVGIDPWNDLGNGLAGTLGIPLLTGDGAMVQGATHTTHLSNALPGSSAIMVLGLSAINLPAKGGILVPNPDILLAGLPISISGELLLISSPANPIPSGTTVYLQFWINDPAGPFGFSASNGTSKTAP